MDCLSDVDCVSNVMAHAQKTDLVFRRKGRVHLNRRWRQFSRLLPAEMCALAVVMLPTPCSQVVWRVLANHSIRQFPLHFPSRVSPCAITFQLDSTSCCSMRRITSSRNVLGIFRGQNRGRVLRQLTASGIRPKNDAVTLCSKRNTLFSHKFAVEKADHFEQLRVQPWAKDGSG